MFYCECWYPSQSRYLFLETMMWANIPTVWLQADYLSLFQGHVCNTFNMFNIKWTPFYCHQDYDSINFSCISFFWFYFSSMTEWILLSDVWRCPWCWSWGPSPPCVTSCTTWCMLYMLTFSSLLSPDTFKESVPSWETMVQTSDQTDHDLTGVTAPSLLSSPHLLVDGDICCHINLISVSHC